MLSTHTLDPMVFSTHKVHGNLIQLLRLPFDVSPLTPLRCMHAVVKSRPDLPLSSVMNESTMALLLGHHGRGVPGFF
jgi:hypothetical protein